MTKNNLIAPSDRLVINSPKASWNISFWDGKKFVGKLFWANGVMEFEGDMKKSAKRFFEFLKPYIDDYIRSKEEGNVSP